MENTADISLVYEDEFLIGIHKPAGMLVHRSDFDRRETRVAMLQARDLIGQHVYPIHRLDRPTSGLIVMGKSGDIASKMQQAFQAGKVKKRYVAIVRGWAEESWTNDTPLVFKPDKIAEKLHEQKEQAAQTAFKCLKQTVVEQSVGKFPQARYSLVEAMPKTGRRHQIRRHLKYDGHPIVGDVKHGDRHHNHFWRDHFDNTRLFLAATDLTFPHPVTAEKTHLNAPLEASFTDALNKLGWSLS